MLRLLLLSCLVLLLLCPQGQAQHYKLVFVHGSPAGELLELIQHQVETPRKLEQMDRFLQVYPKHEAASYLLEWLQVYYSRDNQPDKALLYGSRLLELHPDDFDATYRMRTAAERKNDPALISQWTDRLLALSEKIVSTPPPADQDPNSWKQTVELAKGMLAQHEYELFTKAVENPNPKVKIELLEEFIRKYPDSKYADQVWPHAMNSARAAGDALKALAAAEKQLARHPDDMDAMLLAAQILLEKRLTPQKMAAYAARVVQLAATRPKPENYSVEDWEKRKSYYLGSAHLLIGNMYVGQNNYQQADRSLKLSLPYMKGNEQVEAGILFYLGWANYHMENYREAAGYFRQCLAISGPYADMAVRNLNAMKSERRLVE